MCFTEKIIFSLLPDCFSSRLPGTLAEVENVVFMVETAVRNSGYDELTTATVKKTLASPDLAAQSGADGSLFDADHRWLMRRVEYVIAVLSAVTCFFQEFGNCRPTLTSFRTVLGDGPMLVRLRTVAESRIDEIPPPVGLNPRPPGLQDKVRLPP